MRGTVAKKIRKYSKRNWIEYVRQVRQWPFSARWRFAWYIVFSKDKRKRNEN